MKHLSKLCVPLIMLMFNLVATHPVWSALQTGVENTPVEEEISVQEATPQNVHFLESITLTVNRLDKLLNKAKNNKKNTELFT